MKKHLWLLVVLLAGCSCDDVCRHRQCGSPCPHLMPRHMDDNTLLSAFHASALGRELSREDQLLAGRVLQNLMQTGALDETVSWGEDGTPPYGTFKISNPRTQDAANCLDYRMSLTLKSRTLHSAGTACRNYSGVWRIVREIPLEIR